MNDLNVNPIQQPSESISPVRIHKDKPQKTAQDWVRDMRMSAAVNKATTGVETDQVTPDLLLATSKRLLGISKREQEPDPKDSLAFQRFYGPEMLFSEHILRDNGKLGRNILWKATNRGNLDFMPVGALEKHISSVFYDSKLAQMMDGSSPLETIDSAYKTTRLGEGGIGSIESAPDEMRTVQPSYFGYIDPIRCYAEDTELMTEEGWKKVQDITGDDKLACLINGRLEYHRPTALSVYDYDGIMYGYDDGHIAYLVTPNHRMYTRCADPKRNGEPCSYNIRTAEDIHGTHRTVNTGMHLPILRNEDETVFHLPPVTADLKHEQIYGMPPQGANLKNIDGIDIVDFAEYLGWYLSEGSFVIDHVNGYYRADIAQSPSVNPGNYKRIKDLIERLPFNATCAPIEAGRETLSINRKQLVVYLSQFGRCDDKFIPEWIFNAPLKARLAFRESMLLGDGRAQRHLCTKSKRLAEDFARLQFELGESVFVYNEPEKRYPNHPGIWVVYWHKRKESCLQKKSYRKNIVPYYTEKYAHKVYCPTVPGGIVYCRKSDSYSGFWCGQSPESLRVGLDVYMSKNVMKGTDGKLYQKFIDAKTGKEVLLDSETAANSVIAAPEMMEAKTKSVYALGGPTGIHIVPRSSVQYYLPRADEAYSAASNLIPMLSGVKNMRVQMGCLHPDTNVIVMDKHGLITTKQAKVLDKGSLPGSTKEGAAAVYPIRTTVAKFTPQKNWFCKIILRSGRYLITSADHRWSVLRKGEYKLVNAKDLRKGDIALRSTFKDVPSRRTFINHMLVNKQLAKALGIIARSLAEPDNKKMRVSMQESDYTAFLAAMARIGYTEGFNTYYIDHNFYVGIRDDNLRKLLSDLFDTDERYRHVPVEIMSAGAAIVAAFIDGYTSDLTKMGQDSNDDIWVLDIPNLRMRDELAFLFARLETDTLYRDRVSGKALDLALKLVPMEASYGDMITDEIKLVQKELHSPIMIDIDVDDNLYATANGVVTHNSKYPLQAVSIASREAPLVRGLDEATGKDMPTLVGKYLGARFAPQDGVVTAVRKDRIDVTYNDGTKGKIDMYVNFPMNAKGYINNTPVVKAGQSFKKGDVLASSNYTDDKGVAAIGTNLRTGWLSWKGGTYEDAIVVSESAAKKLTSTTMYKTSVDLDKTISLGKKNYITWKPAEFTKEQMDNLDDSGIVKPGTLLHKEDPMILAVRTTEPSPGTMGKRVLTDLSERWEHDRPGVVTDVVKTRGGVKVYATVTAPAEVGDKLSGCFDDKTEVFTKRGFVLFKDLKSSDKIAVLSKDGTAKFETPLAYQIDHYKGCMVEHKSRRHSMMVTPNHNVAHVPRYEYETGDTTLVKKTAAEVYGKRIFMRVSANFDGILARPEIDTITLPFYAASEEAQADTTGKYTRTFSRSDLAAFLGIYLAEGHCAHVPTQHWIRISQYDLVDGGKERCAQISDLLDRMGLVWHYYDHQYFMINNWPLHQLVEPLGNSYGKYIPDEVYTTWSKEDMITLLDWFYLGDGEKAIKDDNARRCATVSKRLADDLQRLYILTGQCSNVHSTAAKSSKSGIVYKISSAYKEFICVGMGKKHWRIVDDYDGMIYCVTSSTGIILTRRDGIVSWNGQSYGNKGVVSQIIPDDEMPRNAKGEPLELLFSPLGLITRCYDEQTEFLTKDGWKFGRAVKDADELYCYDTKTGSWEWGKQLEPFHKSYYEGPMYGYSNKVTDFCVTPHHKFWAATSTGFSKQLVEDIYGREIRVPGVAKPRKQQPEAVRFELPSISGSRDNVPDTYDAGDWAEFLGWYLAEGHTIYNETSGRYCVSISQYPSDKQDNVKIIASLLDRLGLHWGYPESSSEFRIYSKRLASYFKQFGLCDYKHAPAWLFEQPDNVLYRFLDGLLLGDGYIARHKDRLSFVCNLKLTSEKLIDQVQMICCMLGIASVKSFVGVDPRYPESKPQWYLGISMTDKNTRRLYDNWYIKEYKGNVYCPTVSTGYILTRRNGKTLCAGNTNTSQLYEAQLGKVAKKTGKPVVVPAFFKGSIQEFVADQLKQNHLKPDEDLINPETGLPIKDVQTGYSYIYKLKHLAESKMSARGTSTYDADQQPAGKGMDGCFPATQLIHMRTGKRSIGSIAQDVGIAYVASMDDDKKLRYCKVTDRFQKVIPYDLLMEIIPAWSYDARGRIIKPVSMFPTNNHAIYMYDMTQQHAGLLKPGCKLAGIGKRPSEHQMQVLWFLLHEPSVVEDDKLHVLYDPEAESLAQFEYKILKSLGAQLDKSNSEIVVPNYKLYAAAVTDADKGDLTRALIALTKDDTEYKISAASLTRIADWIPAKYIPDYANDAKQFAEKAQRIMPCVDLEIEPFLGLMPIIVAKVRRFRKLDPVKVYDLTVEGTHRYVLSGGFLVSNSKRFGTLEQSAMIGHGAEEIIRDAKWIRGQSNSDFWRSLRTGDIPTMPGEPLVHKKFFAHLTGAGINVRKTPQGVSIFALTNKDVDELAGPRELRSRDTYEARTFRPIDGGLFGQDIFGINGDKWAYIQLDEPVPNPVMEEPLARLLQIPEKQFADVASGKAEVNGIRGSVAMKAALEKMDLQAESAKALDNYKRSSASNKDKALKRYVAIERMRRQGVDPADYMLDRIPVLPPQFRPISTHNGLTMVADSNYLYAQLLDARDDEREAKGLPKEFQQTARENLYNKWKELTGLYAPSDIKLRSKHVQGLLKWALGDSPKFSALQRKVLSATVDTVGRGAITPDSRLKLNELGIPEDMAFNIFAPMVERSMVKRGYTPVQAMKMVKEHSTQARDVLNEVMKNHPVLMNRAPTLHKLSIMAFNPRLVDGHAIHVNPSIVVPFGADFDGDTVNIHAPVSDKARQEAYAKMFPERNLIGMRSRSIVYKPEKEYQQGLYIGTRMKKGDNIRTQYFNTLEEAKQAYRQGLIDLDDPIEIRNK